MIRANQDACIDEFRVRLVGQYTRFPSGDHERVVEIARYGRVVFARNDERVVATRMVAYSPRARGNRCLFQRIGMRGCDPDTIVGVCHHSTLPQVPTEEREWRVFGRQKCLSCLN